MKEIAVFRLFVVVIGASVAVAVYQEPQGPDSNRFPEVGQPRWPSLAFRHASRPQHHPRESQTARKWRAGINDPDQAGPQRLVALASAEFAGTRAVAYGEFDHHRPAHQQRNPFAQGNQQPGYTRHHSGRRVCSRQAPTMVSHHLHRGRQVRLLYMEPQSKFSCCPGWTQVTRLSFGCNKLACPACLNGGSCVASGKCSCPKQFTGKQCEIGSDDTAFEARDLEADYRPTTTRTSTIPQDTENEVGDRDFDTDYEFILKRLTKLEKLVSRSKRRDAVATDMSAKINLAMENIGDVKRAVESVRLMQQEIYELRNRLTSFERESRKIEHITNRVTDLESRFRIHCGAFDGNGRRIC
ncbi:uncharacterized protein LOC107227181 isoform X2 [Neodiprion lecontei]|uniref:Uncharacterized protein LOC107227181 isoform X2 n=1 Tax=Neodiprion lecontei TaxID=441921 RepID=A0ABM3FDM0_NEOLC|nr:uncharacterized protein LOC107227181 isoform X2 [Neodiprion lecontei]